MFRKYIVFILFIFLPHMASAVDLSKGLMETQDNWNNKESFLTGGANLLISMTGFYPRPMFGKNAGRSLKFDINADKGSYQAGETAQLKLSAQNVGYENQESTRANKRLYYLWVSGNIYFEVFRLTGDVKDGELLLASGMVFKDNKISLYQDETKDFEFSWQIPQTAKSGDYEIRLFPTSDNLSFMGDPDVYRTAIKTRITVNNDKEKEEKIYWKLDEMKLGDESFKLKEKILRIKTGGSSVLTVPIVNSDDKPRKIFAIKQIRRSISNFGALEPEEIEEMTLGPNEKKPITFELSGKNIKDKAELVALFSFTDENGRKLFTNRNNFDFPITNLVSETLEIPVYVIGNTNLLMRGIGIITTENQTIFKRNSLATILLEVERADRLYYESAEKERTKEDNIKTTLTLLDKAGNKIDEIGYDGPSWDRSGQLSKIVELNKKYDYLKLVGVLSSKERGEIQKKEIEFFAPSGNPITWLDRMKEIIENNWVVSVIAATVFLACLMILAIVLIMRKKKQHINNINM